MKKLEKNFNILKELLHAGCQIMPVLKSDAYGNGAVPIAKFLAQKGIKKFAVNDVEEALELRNAGITEDILVLGSIFPDYLEAVLKNHLTVMIGSFSQAKSLKSMLAKVKGKLKVHVRVDVANSGLGIPPHKVNSLIVFLKNIDQIEVEGIFTHLYAAYSPEEEQLNKEVEEFKNVLKQLVYPIPIVHAVSSAAFFKCPEMHYRYARIGTSLYGYLAYENQQELGFQPIMELKSRIVDIVECNGSRINKYDSINVGEETTRVAVVPIGYKHSLIFTNLKKGYFLVGNQLVPILGTPCMNHTIIDISQVPSAQIGEEVTIMGGNGKGQIKAETLAAQLNLSVVHHVVLSMLNNNVPRKYIY
ncbi:MAG: alanine racemase [Clostridia bacterium]|nr:alanine racemase [Clostridia bacterium]